VVVEVRMFAPQIMFDPASAQIRPGERISNRALLRDYADVFGSIDKNLVARQQSVALVQTRLEIVEEFLQLRDETLGQIADLSAHARIGCGKTRAGKELEKIIEFLALSECVEEDCHCAEIERHRTNSHQVRGN